MKWTDIQASSPVDRNAQIICIIVFLVIFLFVVFICALYAAHKARVKQIVMHTSARYEELSLFLEDIDCYPLPQIRFTVRVNSKAAFDRFNFDKALAEHVRYDPTWNAQTIRDSVPVMQSFRKRMDILPDLMDEDWIEEHTKVDPSEYWDAEESLCTPLKKSLWEAYCCTVSVKYTSPAGRNSYRKHRDYSYDLLLEICDRVEQYLSDQTGAKAERTKMTASLRYDVMQRDGFKCVLCGRSATYDGVSLEVDHIIPVSRGGKTTMSNLRTLCKDCNRGKRDKLEE